jgi:hypothetical protein
MQGLGGKVREVLVREIPNVAFPKNGSTIRHLEISASLVLEDASSVAKRLSQVRQMFENVLRADEVNRIVFYRSKVLGPDFHGSFTYSNGPIYLRWIVPDANIASSTAQLRQEIRVATTQLGDILVAQAMITDEVINCCGQLCVMVLRVSKRILVARHVLDALGLESAIVDVGAVSALHEFKVAYFRRKCIGHRVSKQTPDQRSTRDGDERQGIQRQANGTATHEPALQRLEARFVRKRTYINRGCPADWRPE